MHGEDRMKIQGIPYRVSPEGYIDHWLVAGPACRDVPRGVALDNVSQTNLQLPQPDYLEHFRRPVEWAIPLIVGDDSWRWRYQQCLPDHRLDFAGQAASPQYSRRWLYAEIRQEHRATGWIEVQATGTVTLWDGRTCLEPVATHHADGIMTCRFQRPAHQGRISLFLCQEEYLFRLCPSHIMVKWVSSRARGERITLPTAVSAERRKDLQAILEAAYVDRRVHSRRHPPIVRWPESMNKVAMLGMNLRAPQGQSYLEVMHMQAAGGTEFALPLDTAIPDGPYQLQIRPWLSEYYEENQRIVHVLDVDLIETEFEQTPEREQAERTDRLLARAVRQRTSLYSELAKIKMGHPALDDALLRQGQEAVAQGHADAEQALLGLLQIEHEVQRRVHAAVSAPDMAACCPRYLPSGSHLPHPRHAVEAFQEAVCQLLAGQRCPQRSFSHFQNRLGSDLQKQARHAVRDWMQARMAAGFSHCDAEQDLARLLHACNCLQQMVRDQEISDLALMLMDKIFFTIALNSFRGVYGIAATAVNAESLQDARLGALAPLTYWAWGLGGPNRHVETAVSLVDAGYEVPQVIQDIGLFVPDALWSWELHACTLQDDEPDAAGRWSYQTPDFMLSSLQEYRPGQRGSHENVWQATLGHTARIHVNNPEYMSEHAAVPRNFWRGNHTLPWVAQWQEVLFAFYPQAGDPGFTHAHFPVHAFSEHVLASHWAFARKDDGYVALYAVNGLELVREGRSAFRELRSSGRANAWFCCMGGRSGHESFTAFRERVEKTLVMDVSSGTFTNAAGQTIRYAPGMALTVDGESVAVREAMHYDSPFCQAAYPATAMVIGGLGTRVLELQFG